MKRRFSICQWVPVLTLLLLVQNSQAVMPPRPGSDATLPPVSQAMLEAGFGRISRPFVVRPAVAGLSQAPGQDGLARIKVSGTRYLPVLLGDASDRVGSFAAASLEAELFGSWPSGSFTEYYREISYGQFQVTGRVHGWYRLPQTLAYYQGSSGCNGLCSYPTCAGKFVQDLVALADADGIDWGQYDNDGPDGVPNSGDDDGYVDTVMIVHAGEGGECGGNNAIWSHSFFLRGWGITAFTTSTPRTGGGYIKVDDYIIQPEVSCWGGLIEIGVFCHEYGHALGLPDLYDTSGGGNGIGNWGLMSSGSWGGDGGSPEKPIQMCAWSKIELGWVTPTVVRWDDTYDLPAVEMSPTVYKVWSDGQPDHEYFLVENRQRTLNDVRLPQAGLNIWHIDENVIDANWLVNEVNTGTVYGVALEQADGLHHLENKQNRGDSGDPWPGSSGNPAFSSSSAPSSRANTGVVTSVRIADLSSVAMTMTAFIEVGIPTVDSQPPQVHLLSPNGGEVLAAGATQVIAWSATDNVGVASVDLMLSYDGGVTFPETLVSDLVASTSWVWQMPIDVAPNLVVQVRAVDEAGNVGADASDSSFALTDQYPPAVDLTAPEGGELWDIHATQTVRWSAADNIGVVGVDLLLSLDDGLSWNDTIATGLTNSGSHLWQPPARVSPDCRLMVRVRDAAGLTDAQISQVFTLANFTGVAEAPRRLQVGPAAPNPFNPLTTIQYVNPRAGRLTILIFDMRGRRVNTLLDADQPAGPGSIMWNGRDDSDRAVGSGVYYVQAVAAADRSYLKVTLVR